MSIRLGDGTLIAGGAQTFPLLSTMWADHILNDVSWLRADTFSWQSGDVYKSVYEKLVTEYATGTTETEGAITFKRTESGFKISEATQEQAILDLYSSTGVAWYYILDTTNKRFKLPRAKHTSTNVDVFGNGITLGLTDGESNGGLNVSTGSANNYIAMKEQYNVPIGNIATSATAISTTDRKSLGVVSDPTKSGIVGKVQRENDSQYMYLYFFVGNYVQNQTAIDIGQMSEQLNGKADVSLANVSDFSKAITAMMPDYANGTIVTSPTSSAPFVAPKNGWYMTHNRYNNKTVYCYINGVKSEIYSSSSDGYRSVYMMNIPLTKGDSIYWELTGQTGVFYPCKGAN